MAEKQLKLVLTVDDKGSAVLKSFQSSLDQTAKSAGATAGALNLIKWDAITNLASKAFSAIKTVDNLATSTANAGDQIERNARITGLGIDAYQKLQYAARMADVEMESLSTGMKFLSRNMVEASEGGNTAARYFSAMGISVKDATGQLKPLDIIMREIASKFSSWEDGPRKIALAMAIFGRSGQEMIPILNQGAAGLSAMGREFERLGGPSAEAITKLSEADNVFKRTAVQTDNLKFKAVDSIGVWAKFKQQIADAKQSVVEFAEKYNILGRLLYGLDLERVMGKAEKTFTGAPYSAAVNERRLAEGRVPIPINIEALKAEEEALKKSSEYEMKMNAMFPDDAYNLKMAANEAERLGNTIGGNIEKALQNVKLMKADFAAGKILPADLFKGIQTASDLMKKALGDDTTEALVKLEKDVQRRMAAVALDDPDRKKKINAIIDDWAEARRQIEADKPKTMLDVTEGLRQLQTFEDRFESMKRSIESKPITVKVNIDRAKEGLSEFRDDFEEPATSVYSFYGEGSSRKPIMEKIQEIAGGFGAWEDKMAKMEATIRFYQLGMQLDAMQGKIDKFNAAHLAMTNLVSAAGGTGYGMSPEYKNIWANLQAEVVPQIELLQAQMMMELFSAFGEKGAKKFFPGFQTGGYVPRTGLYRLHEGEVVSRSSSLNMGGINIYTSPGTTGDQARQIVDAVVDAIKYKRRGDLTALV